MATKQTELEKQMQATREELDKAREAERDAKAEIDRLPQTYREAREQGQQDAAEAHRQWLAERRGVADSKRERAAVRAHQAEQIDRSEAPIRELEKAERALHAEHRAATVRVAELEARSWQLERGRAGQALKQSGVEAREQAARQAVEDAKAELEAVETEKRQLEGRVSQANIRQHEAQYRARQLRGETPYQGNTIVISN